MQRLTQGPEAGGLHGNGIAGVRVQPGGQELVRGEDNTVEQSADLAFEVLVENSGESQETQVKVTLIIRQDPQIRRSRRSTSSTRPRRRPCALRASRTSSSRPTPCAGRAGQRNNTNNNSRVPDHLHARLGVGYGLDVGSLRRRSLDRHRRRSGGGRGTDPLARLLSEAPAVRKAQLVLLGTGKDDLVNLLPSRSRPASTTCTGSSTRSPRARADRPAVDGCLSHTALGPYNAYEDAGGHQSASLAFLDGARSGVVMSASRVETTRVST